MLFGIDSHRLSYTLDPIEESLEDTFLAARAFPNCPCPGNERLAFLTDTHCYSMRYSEGSKRIRSVLFESSLKKHTIRKERFPHWTPNPASRTCGESLQRVHLTQFTKNRKRASPRSTESKHESPKAQTLVSVKDFEPSHHRTPAVDPQAKCERSGSGSICLTLNECENLLATS